MAPGRMAKPPKIKESSGSEEGEDVLDERRPAASKGPRGLRGRWRAFKSWWRDARWWALPAALAGAGLWFVLAVAALWFPLAFGPDLGNLFAAMGPYVSYFFLAAFICFLAATYLAVGYLLKRREFARLINTQSKGDFVRMQDQIERLAFELGKREQDLVALAKKDFRIRH